MTETDIQDVLIIYLRSEGYQLWQPRHKNAQGPDVVGYHSNRHKLWIIEAKGEINASTDRHLAFEMALDQVCQRGRRGMEAENWLWTTAAC
ncbi:MAG TPA: hypothetical protein VEL31_20630 [Ktedonobacteraceae bacterium]|nr:hypothetical protein [Ktedonobacteraceae bacterium]HYU75081.1 hypothetical protein [Ktedonobacteraceae bacterium]